MSLRNARTVAWIVYLLAFLATTWPGLLLVNRVTPRILGLPFHLAWFAFWIVAVCLALVLVDRVETKAERTEAG